MNNSVCVGILGYGGEVGRTAKEYLYGKCFLRCGQRNKNYEAKNDSFIEYVEVDIFKEEELIKFCTGCDIVLNCSGPSYVIGDRVAKIAYKVGAKYVDAFGADYLEELISEYKGTYILSAGSFPGLSGILPRWLKNKGDFDYINSLEIFAGGEEKCSKGAIADLLLSSVKGFGVPNGYYKKGAICKSHIDSREKVSILGFEKDVYTQEYINKEIIRLAKLLNIEEAHWYNTQINKEIQDMTSKACIRLLVDNKQGVLEEIVDKLMQDANKEIKESWYSVSIKMRGISKGKEIIKNLILKSDDSYRISGLICALVVEQIIENKIREGIHWAFEVLDPKITIDTLLKTKIINSIEVFDNNENINSIKSFNDIEDLENIEEGVI